MLLQEELDEAMEECLRFAKPPDVSGEDAIELLDLSAEELSDCVVVLACALGLAGDDSGRAARPTLTSDESYANLLPMPCEWVQALPSRRSRRTGAD